MASAAVATPPLPWADLQQKLSKKQKFEEAVCECLAGLEVAPGAAADGGFQTLLRRAHVLLRSRFTTPAFWAAGRRLFQAAQAVVGEAGLQAELALWVAECDAVLGDAPGPSSAAAPGQQQQQQQQQQRRQPSYLFEGQFSAAAAPARQPDPMDAMTALLAAQLGGAGGEGSGDGEEQQQPQQQLGPEAREALEAHLDQMAIDLMEATAAQHPQQGAAPPASRKVVQRLPREQLTEERMKALGQERCPVCMEELAVGDKVQVMPCKHCFHPPCLAPWLEDNNSCPTCRHELPTDDQQYERQKVERAEREEERRGVENAISHAEFLYL